MKLFDNPLYIATIKGNGHARWDENGTTSGSDETELAKGDVSAVIIEGILSG